MTRVPANLKPNLSRRKLLMEAGGMFAVGDLAIKPAYAAKRELMIMGWGDYISTDNLKAWSDANATEIIYDSYESNDAIIAKLEEMRGAAGYDIGMISGHVLEEVIAEGLLRKLDKSLIPNAGNLRSEFTNRAADPGNQFTIPKSYGYTGVLFDKTVVTRPIVTWNDYLDSATHEASGRVCMIADYGLAIAPLIWAEGASWNTLDESVLTAVERKIDMLAKHVSVFDSYPMQRVERGQVALVQCWNGIAWRAMKAANNPNLVFVYPGPKTETWLDSYYIPANSANPQGAHSWLNYVLDPEAAARDIEATHWPVPVKGAEKYLTPETAHDPLIFPPADVVGRAETTERNASYDRRQLIFAKLRAAAGK